jgi:hypothetical protein
VHLHLYSGFKHASDSTLNRKFDIFEGQIQDDLLGLGELLVRDIYSIRDEHHCYTQARRKVSDAVRNRRGRYFG